jgi:hypothetical protein
MLLHSVWELNSDPGSGQQTLHRSSCQAQRQSAFQPRAAIMVLTIGRLRFPATELRCLFNSLRGTAYMQSHLQKVGQSMASEASRTTS